MTFRQYQVSVSGMGKPMLVRCRRKLKKIFAGESLRQFRKVFRKPRWFPSLRGSSRYSEPLDGDGGAKGRRVC